MNKYEVFNLIEIDEQEQTGNGTQNVFYLFVNIFIRTIC